MTDDASPRPLRDDERPDDDEIEILEVVGLDEETSDAPDGGDVVVAFDDDEGRKEPGAEAGEATAETEPSDRERLLRLRADFENLRKRHGREREEFRRHATAELLTRLLPILDNFDRALGTETASEEYDAFRDGIALIHRQLTEELRREGLRPVVAVGEMFDPTRHEAVATAGGSGLPAGTVLEEFQRGYFFRDRLLRPALVKVAVDKDGGSSADPDGGEA